MGGSGWQVGRHVCVVRWWMRVLCVVSFLALRAAGFYGAKLPLFLKYLVLIMRRLMQGAKNERTKPHAWHQNRMRCNRPRCHDGTNNRRGEAKVAQSKSKAIAEMKTATRKEPLAHVLAIPRARP